MAEGGGAGEGQDGLKGVSQEVSLKVASTIQAKETIVRSEDTTSKGKHMTPGSAATKRSRASLPKSKTGCRTCKFRRVKCDEGKPICLRCTKFGVECEGYDVQSSINPPSSRQPRPLLPQIKNNTPIQIIQRTAVFQDQSEYQYFLHFRDEVTLNLASIAPQPIWNTVLLRACNDSLALRDLTSSVAALSLSRNSTRTNINSSEHRMFAARYYGKALRGIQVQINTSNDTDATRFALLASLLVFYFESLQGEHANAIKHIKSAMSMMRHRFLTSRRQYSVIRRTASISGLEDEVVDIFAKLDNIIMSRITAPSDRGILEMRYESSEGSIPDTFRDLREANNYMDHHMFCAMPYLAHLPHIFINGPPQGSSVEEDTIGPQLLDQLRRWNSAFAPLLASAWERPDSQDFIAAATLRCLGLVSEMSVRKISRTTGLFVKEATEIIDLTRRVVTNRRYRKTFVFDCGVLPSLFLTVMLCPEQSIRKEIVDVLKLAEGRLEVTWDAVEIARMAKLFMDADPQHLEPFMKDSSALGGLFEGKDSAEANEGY